MPETAVYKYDLSVLSEYQIGASGQLPGMESITIPLFINQFANQQLWSRILGAHTRHDFRSFGGGKAVHALVSPGGCRNDRVTTTYLR